MTWIPPIFSRLNVAILIIIMGLTNTGYAQLGPGGVSHETPNSLSPTQSDCRLWLDASSLITHADGDDVSEWNDISFSGKNDKGYREASDNFLPPYFRDDPSAAINGHPVVTFEDGRMLKVKSSTDLNTESITTYAQTIVLAFRTSEDVTNRQVLWEEGGGWRGMNIFIFNGELYLGAYDNHLDNDVGPGKVPKFGYNYVKTPIQPNTTYVISHIFYAPTDNSLNGYIKGYRNGSYFGTLINGGPENGGIGGVYQHSDPIGIGAVNSDTYNETGTKNNITGQYAFKGRLAEICYYNRLLNDGERIIVENYLGAKYYANIIVNDKYQYQDSYGKDVMGIGQTINDDAQRHSVSQGRNPFEISPFNSSLSFTGADQFLFVGSNGMQLLLTDDNVPNDPGSTKRVERVWRFDETGDLKKIKFRFHHSKLPSLPAGFSKYTLIFDNTSPNYPNFSTENSKIYELQDVGGGFYEVDVDVVSGAFMTIGVLKPQVSFSTAEAYAIEGDPLPDSTVYFNKVYARLNYVPTSPVKIDFSFSDGTATRATDYGYLNSDVGNGISFPIGLQEMPIRLWVKNDSIQEPLSTETFTINLTIGANTTAGLGIGTQSQHTFTIYDNDPPPKIGFAQTTSQTIESVGTDTIFLVRSGNTDGSAVARVKIVYGVATTATLNQDFQYPTYKTINFADGEDRKPLLIDILDDDIDENSEFIKFWVYYIGSAGLEPGAAYHTLEIVDNDDPPTVEFTSAVSQNYETTGSPKILIELDRVSSKDVSVSYMTTETLLPANSRASYGPDYSLTNPGTIIIQAGDTLGYPLNFSVQQDGIAEDDETVEFEITSSINANIGTQTRHVYTIKDYSSFEWKGAAGIGKPADNIFWVDVDRQSGNHDDALQTLSDFSPHQMNINQTNNTARAKLQTSSNLINGRKTLKFDGSNDLYTVTNSGLINMAYSVAKKDYFLVIKTSGNITNRQVIYKQGGASRGFAIYIDGGSLYFNAWNNENNDPGNPWGSASPYPNRYARFDGITANTPYIISCLFDNSSSNKLRIYVNGEIGQRTETGTCGLVYSHSGAVSIGGVNGDVRFHDGTNGSGRYFNGYVAEVIHFTEAPVNETRRRILENYFSGKYNIPLVATDQKFILDTEYTNQIAGIGQINSSDTHTDSQSTGLLRIKSPSTIQNNSFLLWGENGIGLNETWPYSGGPMPAGIEERSGKVWQVSKDGNINGFDLYLRYSELQNATTLGLNDLKLLVHHNADGQNFSGASVINASSLQSGYVAKFSGVNLSNGDFFTLGNSSTITPLPIELLSFTAEAVNRTVELNWITATEIGNEYFQVERAGKDLRFEPILTKTGAGYSNTTNFYSDVDKNPLDGVSYYRLKQVDYDGEFTYSDPVSVHFQPLEGNQFDFWIYPNPTKSNQFTIANTGNIPTDNTVNLSIINTSGQIVYSQKIDPTYTTVSIALPGTIAKGMYMVMLYNNSFKKSYKLVVN